MVWLPGSTVCANWRALQGSNPLQYPGLGHVHDRGKAQAGTADWPVVLLEVQMHAKPRGSSTDWLPRAFAFSSCIPRVQHLAVVVVVRTDASTSAQPSCRSNCRRLSMGRSG
jgi:hypothetical protein